MCGIGGCVARAASPDRDALEAMVRALSHRGPDDSGIELIDSVGLAHTRLSILDPTPAGHQPMSDPTGRWWITYNGEIFNHRALRRQLPPHDYVGGSDTETLLHALACVGEAAVPRCNGLFAYAALDRDRRRLLLVRDRFGVKPLYYARHDDRFWFASEIRALRAAGIPARPDRELVQQSLTLAWVNGPQTALAGIWQLLPGHLVSVDLDTLAVTRRKWYDPAEVVSGERCAALAELPRERACDELEALLRESVRRRLLADVPVGTMCSGGLDSSVIAALARDEHRSIHAFNASVADQPDVDEGRWAERVADALAIELHTVRTDAASWRAGLVSATCHNEHPLVHESSVPMAQIAELARVNGVKVLLSGEAADELLGGYQWLHGLEQRDFAKRGNVFERVGLGAYRALQRAHRRLLDPPAGDSRELEYLERLRRRALRAYSHHRESRRRLEAELLVDLNIYLPHLLNRQDKNTMQHSIETRVPFLDPDVVAFLLNTPLEYRVEPIRKALLRELAVRLLPDAVAAREKVGFGFDTDRYIRPALNEAFLLDGSLREVLQVPLEEWRRFSASLRGQPLLLFVTGEVWSRALIEGSTEPSIESDLWRGGP